MSSAVMVKIFEFNVSMMRVPAAFDYVMENVPVIFALWH
jgi:hypothetical protein